MDTDWRLAPWWPALAALAAALLALGTALLVPVLFSDPNGVDPYSVRLAAVALLMLGIAWVTPSLAGSRPVLLAVAAFTVPFSIWAATPRLTNAVAGTHAPRFVVELFIAAIVQVLVTVAFCRLAERLPEPHRPLLRLGFSPLAALAGTAGICLIVVAGLAIPAELLGRVALQPAALMRDGLWLGPGDLIQGAVQELQFRGVLMGTLERVMKPWLANVVQATVFGFAHLAVVYQGPEAPFVPLTVLLGLGLGYITQRTRSLWPAMLIHGVADVLVDVAVVPGLYGY